MDSDGAPSTRTWLRQSGGCDSAQGSPVALSAPTSRPTRRTCRRLLPRAARPTSATAWCPPPVELNPSLDDETVRQLAKGFSIGDRDVDGVRIPSRSMWLCSCPAPRGSPVAAPGRPRALRRHPRARRPRTHPAARSGSGKTLPTMNSASACRDCGVRAANTRYGHTVTSPGVNT